MYCFKSFQAGIVSKDLTLALEPEAASVYCRTLETVKDIFERNGTKYMVLDCGGKTLYKPILVATRK